MKTRQVTSCGVRDISTGCHGDADRPPAQGRSAGLHSEMAAAPSHRDACVGRQASPPQVPHEVTPWETPGSLPPWQLLPTGVDAVLLRTAGRLPAPSKLKLGHSAERGPWRPPRPSLVSCVTPGMSCKPEPRFPHLKLRTSTASAFDEG